MVSVERIRQFTNIPSEAAWEIKNCLPSPNWPTRGDIEIKNLKVYNTNTCLFTVLNYQYKHSILFENLGVLEFQKAFF